MMVSAKARPESPDVVEVSGLSISAKQKVHGPSNSADSDGEVTIIYDSEMQTNGAIAINGESEMRKELKRQRRE